MRLPLVLPLALAALLGVIAACGGGDRTPPPQSPWAQDRREAYSQLYNITPEGSRMLASLDVRHMTGQPAWFGSTGFEGFAGLGQAKPTTVAHEMGHSYWGAFPVSGSPSLTWETPLGQSLSPALAQYRSDLQTFMLQPPDRYELLRERFRNLPNLSEGDYPDLLHMGEADIVSLVGGDLSLVPPILRKYFDRYLAPGPYQSWEDMLRWYVGLSTEDKRIADSFLALAHIPREAYEGLGLQSSAGVPQEIKEITLGEEKQQLLDFAIEFDPIVGNDDSLKDAAGVDTGFPFWRSYLREMYQLHKRYPGLLPGNGETGRAAEIALAFDILIEGEKLGTAQRVAFLSGELSSHPFLYNFLPILDNRVLVELLGPGESPQPAEALQKGTGSFVEELRRFIAEVDRILDIANASPDDGARALEDYLESLKDQDEEKLKQDIDTVFELFTDTNKETTQQMMARVTDDTIRELLNINPARTRFLLKPERLLDAIDIRANAPSDDLLAGLKVLLDNSSGNFTIDRPFTEEVYRRVSQRGRDSPQETLGIIKEAGLPMPGFLFGHPDDSVFILSSDFQQTLELITGSGPIRVPPVRLIYHLIYVDPGFAARVVEGLSEQDEDDLTSEALIYFAYDRDRLQSNPELKLSVESDALFLQALLQRKGQEWLSLQMASAITRYEANQQEGIVDPDFLDAYRRTLRAALDFIEEPQQQAALEEAIADAFSSAGLTF